MRELGEARSAHARVPQSARMSRRRARVSFFFDKDQLFFFFAYPVFVTEVRAIYRRTLAKTALDAARMVGRLAACAGP